MLRQIRLKNFVKFKDEQILDIKIDQDKPSVISILGPSGSGKSCLLEAFRRCTETTNNDSISTIPNKQEDSIVVCAFGKEATKQTAKFVSIYLSFYEGETRRTIKVLVQNGREHVYLLTRRDLEAWEEHCIDYGVKKSNDLMDDTKDLSKKARILREIYQKVKESPFESNSDLSQSQFDDHFHSLVEIEFIFAVRPLGPTQSSLQLRPKERSKTKPYEETAKDIAYIIGEFLKEKKEKLEAPNYDDEIIRKIYDRMVGSDKVDFSVKDGGLISARTAKPYEETAKNAYIIGEFLKEQKEKTQNPICDEEIERKIYNCIVGSDKVDFFMKDNGLIYARTANSEFSLLKAPEGAIEAKYLSVLLSKTNVNILCIDEPCRGMNHDMINRLIYFVLPNKELVGNKQVILSTSNPDFLTPFLKQNTFLCLRNNVNTTKVIDANKEIKNVSLSNDHLTAIVFSPRIMFVEGPSDLLFVETMRHILLTDQEPFKQFRNKTDGLDYFLINVRMVPLNGCGNKNIEKVCKELGIRENIMFLFDNDVYQNTKETPEGFAKRGIFVWDAKSKTCDGLKLPFVNENLNYDQFAYFIENGKWIGMVRPRPKDTPFTNKPGTLEDVVLRVCVEHDVKHHNNQDEPCTVPGCGGLLNKLKQAGKGPDNIVEARSWDTCKCCKHELVAMKGKFLSQDLSQENIEDLIKNILRVSIEYQEGEIWRFLEFLRTKSC